MITTKMAIAFLDTLDHNCAPTDPDAPEMLQWLALIYPILGHESMIGYNSIPIVEAFLANPISAGLDAILGELTDYYVGRVGHKLAPGIHVAKVDDFYYSSVQVFPNGVGSRSIIAKGREPMALLAIQSAYDIWKKNAEAIAQAEVEARAKS